MESHNKIRSHYYNYIKKAHKQKAHSVHTNRGYWFFLVGAGLGIVFIAFTIDYGFGNILLSCIGIVYLILLIAGLVILINSD
jgi:uncharacterized membrane protein